MFLVLLFFVVIWLCDPADIHTSCPCDPAPPTISSTVLTAVVCATTVPSRPCPTERSQMAMAQFHALLSLQEAVLTRWDSVPPADRRQLKGYLWDFISREWARCERRAADVFTVDVCEKGGGRDTERVIAVCRCAVFAEWNA